MLSSFKICLLLLSLKFWCSALNQIFIDSSNLNYGNGTFKDPFSNLIDGFRNLNDDENQIIVLKGTSDYFLYENVELSKKCVIM